MIMIDRRLKKRIAFMLSLVLFVSIFSSCTTIKERTSDTVYVFEEEEAMETTIISGRSLRPALYFVQRGSNRLVAELRSIIVEDDESPVKNIVRQLITGPSDDALMGVAPEGVFVDRVEVSEDVANVYLISEYEIASRDKFLLKLALANTLADYLDIKYVNVFFNGLSDGFEGYPHPLQGTATGVWTDVYEGTLGRHIAASQENVGDSQSIGITIDTPLYFLDASGEYLLPEASEISYTQETYLERIIQALADGPRNTYVHQASVTSELAVNSYKFETIDNQEYLTIDFSVSPALSIYQTEADEVKAYASIVYTLTSFFPDLACINVLIAGVPVTTIGDGMDVSDGITREDVSGSLAGGITLYFGIKDTTLLMEVNRMVNEAQVWSANVRLYELIKGPQTGEGDDAWPCFPAGISEADILGTNVRQSTIEVNLSRNFKLRCEDMSANEEMLMVFAMVNTLTDMQGISTVQFFVEGEKTEALAGHLYFADLFIKNPGLEQVDY